MSDLFFKEKVLSKTEMLYGIALRILNNTQDAEDAVSEAIIKIWIKKDTLKKHENIDAVLYTIIKNQSIDILRSRKVFLSIDNNFNLKTENENDINTSIDDKKVAKVKAIISNLPEKEKMIIHFRMIEGFSTQKIADLMSLKVNTVCVILSRARKKINTQYENNNVKNS